MNPFTPYSRPADPRQEQSRVEQYEVLKSLFRCRMVEGSSAVQHALRMNGYIEKLSTILRGVKLTNEVNCDIVLLVGFVCAGQSELPYK